MKNRKRIIMNILAVFTLIGLLYCFAAYLYIQPRLTPSMPEPSRHIQTLGALTIPVFVTAGIYHLMLLSRMLKILTANNDRTFGYSFFTVLVILSGITLLSDATLLSEIGKEYVLWDVTGQWNMLYGFTVFHIAVSVFGMILARKSVSPGTHLFEAMRTGRDKLFLAMHQIGLLCGIAGIVGTVLPMNAAGLDLPGVPHTYREALMLVFSILALFPAGLILLYWIVKNRSKPLAQWFDEKQMSDTAAAGLMATAVSLFLLYIFGIISIYKVSALPVSFWLLLVFFVNLAVFSAATLARNRV